MGIRQKTIMIPDGDKSAWTNAQLVTFMCELDNIVSTHMGDCKIECRKRIGADGGKLVFKEHHVSVAKLGKPSETVNWKKLAVYLLERLDSAEQEKLVLWASEQRNVPQQRVTCK